MLGPVGIFLGIIIAAALTEDAPKQQAGLGNATLDGEKTIDVAQAGRALRMRRKQIRTRKTQRKKAAPAVPPVSAEPANPPDTGTIQTGE